MLFLLVSLAARGADPLSAQRTVIDFRAGVLLNDPARHPQLCLEGEPIRRLVLEACGTGQGFLHHADEPDLAHFRARAVVASWGEGSADLRILPGLGFAEAQRGPDAPGFDFGEARSAEPIETAGPEASLSVQGRHALAGGSYVVGDLNGGAAHMIAAPEVVGTSGPWVGFVSFTVGAGF